MLDIYVISLLMAIIVVISYNVEIAMFICLSLLVIAIVNIFFIKRRNLLILIIPLLFLIRTSLFVNFSPVNVGDNIRIETELHNGRGKVQKIDGKIPKIGTYVNFYGMRNGKYEILGKVKKINESYGYHFLDIKRKSAYEKEKNRINEYFDTLATRVIGNEKQELQDLYRAVILGQSYNLESWFREIFAYIGISHIVALSGLHIGLVLLIIGSILKLFPIQRRPRYIIFLICLTLYYLGIKHSPSLTRAYIMGVIFIISKIIYDGYNAKTALATAFIIELFLDPTIMNSLSFKLSFIAVFIILWIYPLVLKILYSGKNKFIQSIILVLIIQAFMSPVLGMETGQLPMLSFISNIILVPLSSIFIGFCFASLILENIFLGKIVLPFIKILYEILISIVFRLETVNYMSLDISINKNNWCYFAYFMVLLIIIKVFEKKLKKEKKDRLLKGFIRGEK